MAKALATLDEEAALIFCRCAFETVVNFHYLRTPNGDETQVAERMRLFKMAGYRPELKIRRNLRGRAAGEGPSLDELDTAALKGLDAYWKAEAMPDKVQDLPGVADRLNLADMDPLAEIYYFAIPSQAIHGTYQNLAKFHLQQGEAEGTVAPRYQADEINATVFQAVVEMSLTVLDSWLLVVHTAVHHRWRDALVELRGRLATVHDALAASIRREE
jgi:hypothetical protein